MNKEQAGMTYCEGCDGKDYWKIDPDPDSKAWNVEPCAMVEREPFIFWMVSMGWSDQTDDVKYFWFQASAMVQAGDFVEQCDNLGHSMTMTVKDDDGLYQWRGGKAWVEVCPIKVDSNKSCPAMRALA